MDWSVLKHCSILTYWSVIAIRILRHWDYTASLESYCGGGWVYLDYSVSSSPFLTFSMRFEFLSEMFDHPVSESRDPSLTIFDTSSMPTNLGLMIMTSCPVRVVGYVVTWPLLQNHNHYSAPPRPNLQYFLVADVGALVVALQINCCHEHVRCLSPDQAPDLWRHMLVDSAQWEFGQPTLTPTNLEDKTEVRID